MLLASTDRWGRFLCSAYIIADEALSMVYSGEQHLSKTATHSDIPLCSRELRSDSTQ